MTEIVSRVFTIVKLKDGTKHGGLKQTSRHEMFTRTEQIFVASHYILARLFTPQPVEFSFDSIAIHYRFQKSCHDKLKKGKNTEKGT